MNLSWFGSGGSSGGGEGDYQGTLAAKEDDTTSFSLPEGFETSDGNGPKSRHSAGVVGNGAPEFHSVPGERPEDRAAPTSRFSLDQGVFSKLRFNDQQTLDGVAPGSDQSGAILGPKTSVSTAEARREKQGRETREKVHARRSKLLAQTRKGGTRIRRAKEPKSAAEKADELPEDVVLADKFRTKFMRMLQNGSLHDLSKYNLCDSYLKRILYFTMSELSPAESLGDILKSFESDVRRAARLGHQNYLGFGSGETSKGTRRKNPASHGGGGGGGGDDGGDSDSDADAAADADDDDDKVADDKASITPRGINYELDVHDLLPDQKDNEFITIVGGALVPKKSFEDLIQVVSAPPPAFTGIGISNLDPRRPEKRKYLYSAALAYGYKYALSATCKFIHTEIRKRKPWNNERQMFVYCSMKSNDFFNWLAFYTAFAMQNPINTYTTSYRSKFMMNDLLRKENTIQLELMRILHQDFGVVDRNIVERYL